MSLRPTALATGVLASLLSVLPALPLRAEEPGDGATRVTILSSGTEDPIAGARLWTYVREDTWLPPGWRWACSGAVQVTDQDGSAELQLGPSRMGWGVVAIIAGGRRGEAWRARGQEHVVALPPADPVAGVVFDGERGRTLANATVRTYIPLDGMCDLGGHDKVTGLGPVRDATETDEAGRFRLEDGGRWRLLSAECAGYATLWMGVTLDERVTAVKVLLPRASGLTGVVRDAAGRPVAGAAVVAHPSYAGHLLDPSSVWIEGSTPHMWRNSPLWKAAHPSIATTDEAGRFVFGALLPDTSYWVWSRHQDGFGVVEAGTVAGNHRRETVDLVLAPLASVDVKVEAANGNAVRAASLVISKQQHAPPYWRHGFTDVNGELTFGSMPPGRYVVRVANQRPAVEAVVDLPGGTERIVLRLR